MSVDVSKFYIINRSWSRRKNDQVMNNMIDTTYAILIIFLNHIILRIVKIIVGPTLIGVKSGDI